MFVEERMYTLKIGAVPEYLRHYQNDGMKVQLKHLPHMVGYYFTEVGSLNMIVHMWAYESLDHRRCGHARRALPPASPRAALRVFSLDLPLAPRAPVPGRGEGLLRRDALGRRARGRPQRPRHGGCRRHRGCKPGGGVSLLAR